MKNQKSSQSNVSVFSFSSEIQAERKLKTISVVLFQHPPEFDFFRVKRYNFCSEYHSFSVSIYLRTSDIVIYLVVLLVLVVLNAVSEDCSRMDANYDNSINKTTDSIEDQKWVKLFPKCVTDFNGSANFMTRALYVAFSIILHRRGILPADYFGRNYITEKMSCMALAFKNPKAYAISQKLKACSTAIKHRYLKEISLVLTKDEYQEEAFEVYCFKFHYFEDGRITASLNTESNVDVLSPFDKLTELEYKGSQSVRDQLVLLVRSILFITQKILKPLPETFAVNFRVTYTDDAPEDFRIDGFGDTDSYYTLPAGIQSANLGHIRPGYHGGILDCSSIFIDDTYEAESELRSHLEKLSDKMGFEANSTYYQIIASESKMNNVSRTSSETMNENLTSAAGTPNISPKNDSPKSTRVTRRSKAPETNEKTSPYNRLRARK